MNTELLTNKQYINKLKRSEIEYTYYMLKMACKTAKSEEDFQETAKQLRSYIFHDTELQTIVQYLKQIIAPRLQGTDQKKPLLAFHLYGWLYGGAERALTSVTNHLVKNNEIILIVFEPIKNNSFKLDEKIKFIPLLGYENRIERLKALLQLLQPDIFVGNNNSIPEFVGIYPYLTREGIKSIAYNHEYYFFPHNHKELFTSIVDKREALSQCTAATFLTNFSLEAYRLSFNNATLMHNPNSFLREEIAGSINTKGSKRILAVGRFDDPIKRLDRILSVFHYVTIEHPDAQLTVVGPYNLEGRVPLHANETIREMLDRFAFTKNQINFVGEQTNTALFYQESDLMLMTSDNEGFSLVLTEAATFSLPVVMFDIPGLDDIVIEGENGFILSQDDIEGMAARVSLLLSNETLRLKMSAYAAEYSKKFDISEIGSRWDQLVNIILNEKNQEAINEALAQQSQVVLKDETVFLKQVMREYEKVSVKLTNQIQKKKNL